LRRLEKVAHAGESLLAKVRDGVLAINEDNTTALLKTLDRLREIVGGVAEARAEPEGDDTELLALLRALTTADATPATAADAVATPAPPPPPPPPPPAAPPPAPSPARAEPVLPAETARQSGSEHNAQILEEFLVEAQEIFDRLDLDFVQLEQTPQDEKLLSSIFRAMHMLKGSSGFFSFRRLEAVAHAGESLLARVREGELVIDKDHTNVLLQTLDCLREIVAGVARTRQEPAGDDSALIAALRSLTQGSGASPPPVAAALSTAAGPAASAASAAPSPGPASAQAASPRRDPVTQDSGATPKDPAAPAAAEPAAPVALAREAAKTTEVTSQVRVNVDLLDKLMNLVSEMVLARNRLMSFAANSIDPQFTNTVRTIDFITLDLQERMMKTRMQPISTVWSKFPRLVRDAAQETGKKVELIQIGAETELDRSVLESIRDPLIHIIRNAVDHGIELPAERLAKGKRAVGTVTLSSMHESGMIVIDVRDDGAGINIPLVVKMAVQKGLVSAERVQKIAYGEIIDLICQPGFSTRETITTMSGRGVGLDVVRTNVQKIGGSVDISTSDQGTRIRMRIPLTLAIMPALFVECAGQRFAVPQNNLFEMLRYEKNSEGPTVEEIYGVAVVRLRTKLIPLIYLGRELRIDSQSLYEKDTFNIVVVQAAGVEIGLVVDKVLFMQEVVVKSVSELLRGSGIYSGATILGDGRVAMIFDIGGLALRSGLLSKLNETGFRADIPEVVQDIVQTQTMLMFNLVETERVAIPLYYVERLEMFAMSRVERQGNHDVIIYRDQIMKLVWLSDFIESPEIRRSGYGSHINVIVHYQAERPIGFVVNSIRDIVEISSEIVLISPRQQGIQGSAILGDSVVSILDVQEILRLNQLERSNDSVDERDEGLLLEDGTVQVTT
jgi:two-component system chemotaxis sensor kinase CheA